MCLEHLLSRYQAIIDLALKAKWATKQCNFDLAHLFLILETIGEEGIEVGASSFYEPLLICFY